MKHKVKIICGVVIVIIIVAMYFLAPYKESLSEGPLKELSKEKKTESNSSQSRGQGRAQALLNVNCYVVEPVHLKDKIISVANVLPDEEVDLSFEASGKVVNINFVEGARVSKGDLLAKVNDKPLQAQLLKLQAQRKLAEDRLFRQRALLDKDAVSKETYETVFTNLETINADIQLVEANIALTELRAPFDGVIGLRYVSEGAYVSPSKIIAKIAKIQPLKLEFSIPEMYTNRMKAGATVLFHLQGSLSVYQAKVYALESKLNATTKTLTIRALYPNTNNEITPGRFASVEVNMAELRNAIAIPTEAIVPELGVEMVFLYKGGKAQRTSIKTGIRTPSMIQVTEGLAMNDTVITSGILQLREGLPVTIDGFVQIDNQEE